VGGYLIYYGNPIEAVMYFKRRDAQINSEIGECPSCGNVNPELIFNIIDHGLLMNLEITHQKERFLLKPGVNYSKKNRLLPSS